VYKGIYRRSGPATYWEGGFCPKHLKRWKNHVKGVGESIFQYYEGEEKNT